MRKVLFSATIGSMISLLFFTSIALADTTIGTNISTTGTLTVKSDSATAVLFQNAAGDTSIFKFDSSNKRLGLDAFGGTLDTTLEVGGTASISGIITLADGQVRPRANATTAFRFQNAAGTTDVLAIDTTNSRVGVGTSALTEALEVVGNASISGDVRINGNDIIDSGGTTRLTIGANNLITGNASVSAIFEVGSSDLFVSTTGIGVNTSNLVEALEVVGTASISSELNIFGALEVAKGAAADVAYSRFGSATAGNALIAASNDLLISGDFELDGKAFFDGTASVAGDFEVATRLVAVTASISDYRLPLTTGGTLGDCDAAGDTLNWDTTTGKFSCGTDASGSVKTEESGAQNLAAATNLDFNGGKFTLTASGTTESGINLDWGAGGPASLSQDETVSGKWLFSGASTQFTLLELGGTASISGIITLADGQVRPRANATTAFRFQNAAGATTVLNIDTTNARVGIGTDAPLTVFEVQGTASAGFLLTVGSLQVANAGATVSYSRFGTATTTHAGSVAAANDLLISGDLEVNGSVAFDGFANFTSAASVALGFEVAGNALVNKFVAGATTASASAYVAEFASTATTSVLFGTTSTNKGICLQIKDTTGAWVFARISGNAWVINSTSCR